MDLTIIKNSIKTAISYATWAIITPPFFLILFPFVLLPKHVRHTTRGFYAIASIVSWIIIKASFLHVVIEGKEHLPNYPHTPAIIIMNHASALDIPLTQLIIGSYPYAWIGHERYGKTPILGVLFRRMHISLKKMSGNDGRIALLALYNAIKDVHRHALIFPEGTRYDDGNIHTFYQGFAMLSQKLNRPVIPIYISGMHKIYPKPSLTIDSSCNTVKIIVGEPMYPTKNQGTEDFVHEVHRWFEKKSHRGK